MEVSFLDLKEREVINVYDGKKLGRIIDVVFNNRNGIVKGIVVPGDKKIFRKAEDLFIPIEKIKRIGNDVILVGIQTEEVFRKEKYNRNIDRNIRSYENSYNNFYMANNYYPENYNRYEQNIKRPKNKMIYDNARKTEVNNYKNSPTSYVRLKPLERKKYE